VKRGDLLGIVSVWLSGWAGGMAVTVILYELLG
jgi:hypothetical protein